MKTGELRGAVPPPWLTWSLTVFAVAFMALLRLWVFQDRYVALTYALPLLLAIWTRDVKSLYAMSAAFSVIAALKSFWIMPAATGLPAEDFLGFGMQLGNIWVTAGAIHGLLALRTGLDHRQDRLERTVAELDGSNAELNATNEELASREEEILSQNEELQSQSEELERQAEELRQQAEESERQAAELQELNQELARREKGMQTLLESARWMRSDLDEQAVMDALCQAAVQVIGDAAQGAAVVVDEKDALTMRGHAGFGIRGAVQKTLEYSRSFSTLVTESERTAALEDAGVRPDLELPQPSAGRPFRSALGTPIWMEGRPVATLEIYSHEPRRWTEEHFRVVEWLAAQSALALQALRTQKELDLRRRDAEEASLQKTRFLAAVSHDVRTPTNAISLLADLIEMTSHEAQDVAEIQQMASDLKSNARALVELVSDVLDLTRFDAGRFDVECSEFSLSALLDSEIRQAAPSARSKGLETRLQGCEREVWLRTDRMKLARILSNLIGNAIKFTQKGEVVVACEPRNDGGVDVRVIDTGIGIASDQMGRIFDEFFQLRNPERDRTKGTGLGLAICKRLVEGLGCSISVTSVAGHGTTFSVHLPSELVREDVDEGEPNAEPSLARIAAARTLDGLRILLVEDHDVTRRTVAQLLSARGATVREASRGRDGIRLLDENYHDALILDLMLPDLDGTEILKHLRIARPSRLRCVLAVSGDVRDARIDEVKRLGADDMIPKPIDVDRLVAALHARLSESTTMTTPRNATSARDETTSSGSGAAASTDS